MIDTKIPQGMVDACFEAWSTKQMTIEQRVREVLTAAGTAEMYEALDEVLRDAHMNRGYIMGETQARIRVALRKARGE